MSSREHWFFWTASISEEWRMRQYLDPPHGRSLKAPRTFRAGDGFRCEFEWSLDGPGTIFETHYAAGGDLDDACALLVARELARRFTIVHLGSSRKIAHSGSLADVGSGLLFDDAWEPDSPPDPDDDEPSPEILERYRRCDPRLRYGPYLSWASWLKDYQVGFRPELAGAGNHAEVLRAEFANLETDLVAQFFALDARWERERRSAEG